MQKITAVRFTNNIRVGPSDLVGSSTGYNADSNVSITVEEGLVIVARNLNGKTYRVGVPYANALDITFEEEDTPSTSTTASATGEASTSAKSLADTSSKAGRKSAGNA